jgi:hypothetical protein
MCHVMGRGESLVRVIGRIQRLNVFLFWQFVAVCLRFGRIDSVVSKTITFRIFSVLLRCFGVASCEQFIEIVFLCFA